MSDLYLFEELIIIDLNDLSIVCFVLQAAVTYRSTVEYFGQHLKRLSFNAAPTVLIVMYVPVPVHAHTAFVTVATGQC